MSLILASRLCESLGITVVTVTPDPVPQFAIVTADRDLTPGMAAKLRARVWLAVLDHRRHNGESAAALDEEPWTFAYRSTGPDAGSWRVYHPSCRLAKFSPDYDHFRAIWESTGDPSALEQMTEQMEEAS